MPSLRSLLSVAFTLASASVCLASSWQFTDASVSVHEKGDGVGGGSKHSLIKYKSLKDDLVLKPSNSLKILLTAQDGKTAKRPHQAFLLLRDVESGLDISYPFTIKNNGKAKIDLSHKDLPSQFLRSSKPIEADLVLASFGPSSGYRDRAFSLDVSQPSSFQSPATEKPLRYGKREEIHHIFKQDPKSPYALFSVIFTGAVLATIPAICGTWLYLGANVNQFSDAFSSAPISHSLFLGSIIGIEGVFFLYYTSWKLFTTLPVLAVLGAVAFLGGSRALTEVQKRRFTGLR